MDKFCSFIKDKCNKDCVFLSDDTQPDYCIIAALIQDHLDKSGCVENAIDGVKEALMDAYSKRSHDN